MTARQFLVKTSSRLETLFDHLAAVLEQDPLPPLVQETIVVPGQGLARWLSLQLAERCGIAASLHLPFPGAFVQHLLGDDAAARLFSASVLQWRLFRLLGDARGNEFGQARRYCERDPDGQKRFQLSQRLAACFDDYQLYRGDLLLQFARSEVPKNLGPHASWQAQLWRALLADAGLGKATAPADTPRAAAGPSLFPDLDAASTAAASTMLAHRLERLRQLLADPVAARSALPPRVLVFGTTTLPPAVLRLLHDISAHVPVALFVPTPTPHFLGDQQRADDDGAGNPLLRQFGAEAREFQALLHELDDDQGSAIEALDPLLGDDGPVGDGDAPPRCLQIVQHDIAAMVARGGPDGPPRMRLAADDDSLRVHCCHSPLREFEVLKDQILAAFAADPTLQPHDVLVLAPDLERYAPYAHAVFAPLGRHLPYHVADRSPASELPLCATLLRLVELARERLVVFDVLHLLEEPALARRFALSPGDAEVLRLWCQEAGVRWGFDGQHRNELFQLPDYDDHTWRQGIERLLLGVCAGPGDTLVQGRLPVADATDSRAPLLGRFVHFVTTLFAQLRPLARAHPLPVWADHLDAVLEAMFAPIDDDQLALGRLRAATAALRHDATAANLREAVPHRVLVDHLRSLLQQQSGSRGFLSGAVTVAAMLPMRTVPVRLLCLCGLDDAAFPRRDRPLPFDLIAQAPRTGDRSASRDDRQLFLDALLAARERLHITYVGRSQQDNSECAPSLVVTELLDYVDAACAAPDGTPARKHVLVEHPLQAQSRRYRDGSDARLFTHGAGELPAAGAIVPAWPTLQASCAELGGTEIPLSRLWDFWRHPSRFWLRQVLQLQLPRQEAPEDDAEPFGLDALGRYQLRENLVNRAMSGGDANDELLLLHHGGRLPPRALGHLLAVDLRCEAELFVERVLARRGARTRVRVRSGDTFVTGEFDSVSGEELLLARPAQLKDKDWLRGYLHHVVLSVARQQGATLPAVTRVVGLGGSVVFQALGGPLGPDPAVMLAKLLDGLRAGLVRPLPFFEHSSAAFATEWAKTEDDRAALDKARRAWMPQRDAERPWIRGDAEDEWTGLCWRDRDPLQEPAFASWARDVYGAAFGIGRKDEK